MKYITYVPGEISYSVPPPYVQIVFQYIGALSIGAAGPRVIVGAGPARGDGDGAVVVRALCASVQHGHGRQRQHHQRNQQNTGIST